MEEKFKKELKKLKNQIIKEYKPEKIILFGSLVNSKIGPDSDIDLLIVKKTTKSFGKRIDEVSIIANGAKIETPKDIIVFTPLELKKRLASGDFFIVDIVNNGKVLYEKK